MDQQHIPNYLEICFTKLILFEVQNTIMRIIPKINHKTQKIQMLEN